MSLPAPSTVLHAVTNILRLLEAPDAVGCSSAKANSHCARQFHSIQALA